MLNNCSCLLRSITYSVSHQNTYNYRFLGIDYNKYVDTYDLVTNFTYNFLNYLFHLKYRLKSKHETLKQTLILVITKENCFNRNGSVPHIANAMPIHMVKTAF